MKHLLRLLSLALIITSCSGNDSSDQPVDIVEEIDSTYCNCAELVYDEGYNHFFRYERRESFNGICETFHPNGQLWEHKPMTNGKIHGRMITYYDSGQIKEEKEFDMNFQTGEQLNYNEAGEVVFHALYNRGRQIEILINRPHE